VRPPLIVLLCAVAFVYTFSIGAFPSLLPEIARSGGIPDWQLGIFAGAFGFARMVADLPVGLFIVRHLRAGFIAGPIVFGVGVLVLSVSDGFAGLFAGRALMGVGHALNMLSGLTAILHAYATRRLPVALNAFEFSAMLGLLGGAGLSALLPNTFAWKTVLLTACAPQLFAFALLPVVLARLPRRFESSGTPTVPSSVSPSRRRTGLVSLAFAAGCATALSYSSVEQLELPIRGSREFGLDRAGIARLFMLMMACDIVALLPIGILADRTGSIRVVAGVMFSLAAGSMLITFAPLPGVTAGVVLFGLGMAGWMIPLSVLRRETPPGRVAWRTAVYRVGVDAGMFAGPLLGGLLAGRHLVVIALALVVIGIGLLRVERLGEPALQPVQYPP
jgi:MFS family permease